MLGNDIDLDPWGDQANLTEAQMIWRERERRQRTVRFLMMFLLMLLLMDGEEQNQRRRSRDWYQQQLRKKAKEKKDPLVEKLMYETRLAQDERLVEVLANDKRYKRLVQKNDGKDIEAEIRLWAEQQPELEKDEFAQDVVAVEEQNNENTNESQRDPAAENKVWHYPWNATGFYRGEWRWNRNMTLPPTGGATASSESRKMVEAFEVETPLLQRASQRMDSAGVYLLPEGVELNVPNISNAELEDLRWPSKYQRPQTLQTHQSTFLRGAASNNNFNPRGKTDPSKLEVTLSKSSGRVAFQLYSRSVAGTKEISILDGFVKLYDSNTIGYSTRRDILLRVNGVMLHSIGKISMVSTISPGRSALVINPRETVKRRKLLEELIWSLDSTDDTEVASARDQILHLFPPSEADVYETVVSSIHDGNAELTSSDVEDSIRRRLLETRIEEEDQLTTPSAENKSTITVIERSTTTKDSLSVGEKSKYVIPYPYVKDDEDQSIRKARTPASRSMPPREQLLEANAGGCEFEINMNAKEEQWTIGEWRALMGRHVKDIRKIHLDSAEKQGDESNNKEPEATERAKKYGNSPSSGKKNSKAAIQDQALVMIMNGTINSPNCNFFADINATAIRTDWEHTTGKAINYSFYMMLTCLTQIVLLLRQLLHTQAQSAATRVSLLCIGWQTVLDALLCLVHIYLSLAMQPLFTAFASVAFFKLLIFCVIEMKYMAIIIQARNSSNGGTTLEILRRQIAMLHLRFYVALVISFLAFFYAWDSYRTLYMLCLYSFWVPQIIRNIATEAKRPLHPYYVAGMSITRLVAPLYIFAVKNNFLKEVYPDSPTNVFMCELLILWVGIQAIVLEAQGRYGARFMIPARFLPPKFDYNRPIPRSLLPEEEAHNLTPSEYLQIERGPATDLPPPGTVMPHDASPTRLSGGARNRIKGSRVTRAESGMTTETVSPPAENLPVFDCVICYNNIDIRNRRGYMLAPCDHLFHKDCLVQWMEVKMECPICRKELPSL